MLIATVWRAVTGERALMVAIRCQAVDVARKISTVWRAVATGGGYGRVVTSGGYG